MNILYLIPSLKNSGGMERVLTEKVNYLSRNFGHSITIITTEMDDNDEPFFKLDPSIKIIKFKIFFNKFFSINIFSKIIMTIGLLKQYKVDLFSYISTNRVDVCISMGGKEVEFLGSLNIPCKKIYECHFDKNFKSKFLKIQGKNGIFWDLFGIFRDWQHTRLANKFDLTVVLTLNELNSWAEQVNNVTVLPNPSPLVRKYYYKKSENFNRIISIGNLVPVKGYELLIEAWDLIAHKYPHWKVDIFGQGELKDNLQHKINSLNLQSTVRLLGITNDVEYELSQSSFFVMSSISEGLPMVLIESITCGLPIISFDCGSGPREIIHDNDCGILVINGNIQKLSVAIETLIKDEKLRNKMSWNGYEKAKKYDLDHIMKEWEDIFQNIIHDRAGNI